MSDYLKALVEPLDAVLRPLGFRTGEANDLNSRWVACEWESDDIRVKASFEPAEGVASVEVATRALGSDPWPPWGFVELGRILGELRIPRKARRPTGRSFVSLEEVRRWAEASG